MLMLVDVHNIVDEKIDEAQKNDNSMILPGDIKLLDEEIKLRLHYYVNNTVV